LPKGIIYLLSYLSVGLVNLSLPKIAKKNTHCSEKNIR
jgi:hypothetical protein